MTVLHIDAFGGEMPSVSPRALPPQAAQVNANLLLSTSEYRPLSEDATVAQAPSGTRSIYRFARQVGGDFNTDVAHGWITSPELRNYVKGQLNDDLSERTYFTTHEGSEPLRVLTLDDPDPRLVGVPAPLAPKVTLDVTDELTPEEADQYWRKVLPQVILEAAESGIRQSPNSMMDRSRRNPDGTPYAGPYDTHGLIYADNSVLNGEFSTEPYFLVAQTSGGILQSKNVSLSAVGARLLTGSSTGPVALPISALPFAYWYDEAAGRAALTALKIPAGMGAKSGTAALTPSQVNDLVARCTAWFDPDRFIKPSRELIDNLVLSLARLLVSSETGYFESAIVDLQAQAKIATQQAGDAYVKRRRDFSFDRDWLEWMGGMDAFLGPRTERFVDTRFYLATFVTDWGEESAPSEPSGMLEPDQNDSVTITRPLLPDGETQEARHITAWRLYRSNAGSDAAAFQFVEELPYATTSYTDDKSGAELGEVCPTVAWAMPPRRESGVNPFLRGLVGMPNGIMAGFLDNMVAFCEPFVPYAWPVEYQITTEFPIVGLGVFGQTLFVGTKGNPYFITGADSASMSAQKLDARQSCASMRSIATVQGGVLYASPDGLCVADPNGVRVVSKGVFTREDWQALNPESMVAQSHENIYYLFYGGQGGGCLSFDLSSAKLGRVDLQGAASFSDTLTDMLYVVDGVDIKAVFGGTGRRSGAWKSQLITLPTHTSFAWLQVLGDQSAAAPLTLRLYGDAQLRHTAVIKDTRPVRMPPGRWVDWELELAGAARATRVVLASSTAELQQA